MSDYQDATAMAQAVKSGAVSPTELVEDAIEKIATLNPTLNAVVHLQEERALEEAKKRIFTNKQPFAGVPLLLKDLGQQQAGEPSTAASPLFATAQSKKNDYLVSKLEAAGFIILGRTNTPEFGLKNITDSQLWGVTNNPYDRHRNAGGSSGGSAVAVASDMVPLAMASDGGGSIRIPASFTGLIGLKPSRGRVPVGPGSYRGWQGASVNFAITKSVRDTRLLLETLQVTQMESPFMIPKIAHDAIWNGTIERPLRIGYIEKSPTESLVGESAREALGKALRFLEAEGHVIEKIDWPVDGVELMKNYYIMMSVETAAMVAAMEKRFGRAILREDMELMSWAIYRAGMNIRAMDYSHSLSRWDDWSHAMTKVHEQYDVIVTPTVSDVAPTHHQLDLSEAMVAELENIDRVGVAAQQNIIWRMFEKSLALTPFTQLANITGQPAISLPIYQTKLGLPIGVQVMAAKGREDVLLQVAALFEEAEQFEMQL